MLSRRETLAGLGATLSLTACARAQDETPSAPAPADLAGAQWRAGPDLPLRTQEIYPAILDDVIYLAGGLSPDTGSGRIGISDRVFALPVGAETWREIAALPLPIHHPNLVALENQIYAIGGFTASNGGAWTMSRAVRVYDRARDEWSGGPDMAQPFAETVAVVLEGRIHVVTGRRPSGANNRNWSDHADTNAHIVFDPGSQTWASASPAPTARNSAAGSVLNGQLHVVGGRTVTGGNSAAHEAYDPHADRWTRLAPLPQPESGPAGAGGLAVVSLGGALYAFGGEWFDSTGGGVYSQIWRYDPQADSWSEAGRMPTPRHGLGAVVHDNAIWMIAGAAQAGGNDTSAAVEIFTP